MQLRRVLSLSRDQRSLRALNRGRLLPPLLLPHKKIPLPDDQSRLQKPAKAALPYKQSPLHKETMHQLISRVQSANAQWAEDVKLAEPSFFEELAKGQAPKILWLGCSDSRVPESVIMAARPGDIFVHRNIANQFHPDDDSALSVLAYAVDTVKVEHVIVVGHTCCGGAAACLNASKPSSQNPDAKEVTPLQRWLTPLTNLAKDLNVASVPDDIALPLLVQENVKAQVQNVINTSTIQNAWKNGVHVHVHGWVYEIERGLIRDLGISEGPPNDKHYQHKESTVNVGSGADILARAEADAKDV